MSPVEFTWGNDALEVQFRQREGEPFHLSRLGRPSDPDLDAARPVVEILTLADGRNLSSRRLVATEVGMRLTYRSHEHSVVGPWAQLTVLLEDPHSGIRASLTLRCHDGIPAVRSQVTITSPVRSAVILAAPSLCTRTPSLLEAELVAGRGEWLGEGNWTIIEMANELRSLDLAPLKLEARGAVARLSTGCWSTGGDLPVAILDSPLGEVSWAWQIEHNGPWRWELGQDHRGGYLALSGPTDIDHQFVHRLGGAATLETVPVTVAFGSDRQNSVAALTKFRRVSRRAHPDNSERLVIFNDYMNTLMADPSTEKLLPLIAAAAQAGAEIFCIDAGWYSDEPGWWDAVGDWTPSTIRFPNGLSEVIDHIRASGMRPGLWLEPEMIGVRSPLAETLPEEAFFSRLGEPRVEQGRRHLDLRHKAARQHLDDVIDRLIEEFGICYFKFDYNIDPGPGPDREADSSGAGLLAHNRAHLAWIDGILDRHEGLILENCASGGMRSDFALLSRMQLQSTSDQMSPLIYAVIANTAPLSMLPEQAANWAYPQPDMTDEEIVFTLCTSLLGRFYLSGHLDHLHPEQLAIVVEAVEAHKSIRPLIGTAYPFWPLGIPAWEQTNLALGLAVGATAVVVIWSRGGAEHFDLDLPQFRDRLVQLEEVFPARRGGWSYEWIPTRGVLQITKDIWEPSARVVRLTVV